MIAQRSPFRRSAPSSLIRGKKDEAVELLIYDEIGFWGITAKQMADTLAQLGTTELHVRINSPGGDVFDGVAIYNALRQYPGTVITHIDGLAASIASVIALAGEEVRMAPNAFFMIHNPWGVTIGDAEEHRKMADTLEKIGVNSIAKTYQAKTGADLETIETWMNEETWFSAEEAEQKGFADVVEEGAEARTPLPFDLSMYARVPEGLQYGSQDVLTSEEMCDLEGILKSAGLTHRDRDQAVSAFRQWLQKSAGAPVYTPQEVGTVPGDLQPVLTSAEQLLATLRQGQQSSRR